MAFYAVFKYGTSEEQAIVCFELIKMTGGTTANGLNLSSEYIQREHV